ncbi:hypothetical protein F3Y22_tig00110528pilonHSYRG00297 [Hibiscus syriacus]|uniref:Uncharacterized protein n=1 Tax=Hibiscus syriacus TaxID=106335 RepID=A0A6A3AEP2_HIBSY|nr:hypothetical protein F3Y22_tig00110528pilonHSYRG00297 [Hibiscus syriacus]
MRRRSGERSQTSRAITILSVLVAHQPALADGGLSTVIAKPNGASGEFLSSSLGRWQNRGSNPDRGLFGWLEFVGKSWEKTG